MSGKLSRRHLLGALAAAGVTSAAALASKFSPTLLAQSQPSQPILDKPVYLPHVSRQPTPTPTVTPTPTPTVVPGTMTGKVVHVHSNSATTWTGQTDYWNYVNQNVVNNMVNTGLTNLTGQTSVVSAWQALLPNYQVGQGIAIKVNFNNCSSCSDVDGQIDALIQPVNAVVRGLLQAGVQASDVWLYDAIRTIPTRFATGSLYTGVRFFGGCRETAGISNQTITFHPPAGIPMPPTIKLTNVLVNAHYVIDMPIMKNHSCAGVTLAFKNHFGSIDNPGGLHDYTFCITGCRGAHLSSTYNPLVDLYNSPHIGGKTILVIGDGIYGCKGSEDGMPGMWSTFGNRPPSSLCFATDPVAADSVMCDILAAEPGAGVRADSDNYLRLAADAGLGVYERGNPWIAGGYQHITYRKIEV
jgi:hypothetical protein